MRVVFVRCCHYHGSILLFALVQQGVVFLAATVNIAIGHLPLGPATSICQVSKAQGTQPPILDDSHSFCRRIFFKDLACCRRMHLCAIRGKKTIVLPTSMIPIRWLRETRLVTLLGSYLICIFLGLSYHDPGLPSLVFLLPACIVVVLP